MVDGATVSVAVVSSRTEAELIVGMLRSHGVSAAVSADDAGGQYPQMQIEGVQVLVAPADEASARRLLPPPMTASSRGRSPRPFVDGTNGDAALTAWPPRPRAPRLRATAPAGVDQPGGGVDHVSARPCMGRRVAQQQPPGDQVLHTGPAGHQQAAAVRQ